MGYLLTPIKAGSGSRMPLDDISDDVKEAVEDGYKFCADSPQRLQLDLGDLESAEAFLHEARSYAYRRPAGRVTVVGNVAAKKLVRFRVEEYVKPSDE
jgi:hypothetical protein